MEFDFDINSLLPEEITVVDGKLCPFKSRSEKGSAELKKDLSIIIDAMGIASSKAQGLRGVITNAKRLTASNHRLYIIKDAQANNAKGSVVGIIKVGQKKLFLLDIYSQQLEVNPLCVLDFYVHEKKQRSGYGLRLFRKMLERENVKPQCLAFDRPSSKFLNFLRKHFDLQNVVNQMNNYVVFDIFFRDLAAVGYVPKNRRFVSSAPLENRQQNCQDKRQIFSANLSERLLGPVSRLSTRNQTTDPSRHLQENSSLSSILPPRPPARQGRSWKDASWHRRNASNVSFSRTGSAADPVKPNGGNSEHIDNIYSRHANFKERFPVREATSNTAMTSRLLKTNPLNLDKHRTILPNINNDLRRLTSPGIQQNALTATVNDGDQQKESNDNKNRLQTQQSYSINNLYRQTTSMGTSSRDTAWNLFGVHLHSTNDSRNAAQRRQTFFPG